MTIFGNTKITDGTLNVGVKALGTALTTTDNGLITNTAIHGLSTGGGGTYVDVKVNPSGALTVDATVSTSVLPTGASTSALQTTGNTSLSNIDTKTPALVSGRVPVDGSGVTQPISATALPLPAGASTSALQTTGNTSLASIDTKIVTKAANTIPTATDTSIVVADSPNRPATYGASITNLGNGATTDIFTITGSATKTIKIKHLSLTGTQTTAAIEVIQLVKRSTANTGGTGTVLTNVPFDSTNPAATATVQAYTVSPTLGTQVGVLQSEKVFISGTTTDTGIWVYEGKDGSQDITLRGTNEVLAINLVGGPIGAGASINIDAIWTEI